MNGAQIDQRTTNVDRAWQLQRSRFIIALIQDINLRVGSGLLDSSSMGNPYHERCAELIFSKWYTG